ncbi:MAG TPA: amidohydrolase family protein [Chloroflexota bacterium]|nr:amidohydrolase family protein [Chloroflexota bacterium]
MHARPPVIDADGHYLERPEDIRKYLPAPWNRRQTPLWPADQPWDSQLFNTRGGEAQWRQLPAREQVARWVRLIEEQQLEAAILFPTGSGGVAKLQEREFAIAVARAVNDYVAHEFNGHDPRVRAVGVLPLRTPEAAAAEMRRAVRELGLPGFELLTAGLPLALGDPFYDPIWAEAEALGVPLCIHGTRSSAYEVGADRLRTFSEVHCYAFTASMLLQFTSIIFNAVPLKFPKLKLAFLETGATWLPYYLDRMDEHWEIRGELETPWLTKKPSDVVREAAIYFSIEAEETLLPQTLAYLGDEHFVYASDVPHWDSEFPRSLQHFWERPDIPVASKEKVLLHNARRLYGLETRAPAPA